MSDSPLVSICIPTYNGEKYIQETILSVLNQTEKRFELLIIDDCSTDNTIGKILEIQDSRIKLIQNSVNLGFTNNWNRALSESHLPYFKLIPQDDLIDARCLELQINAFEHATKTIALVSCARNIINENSRIIFHRGLSSHHSGYISAKLAIQKIVQSGGNPIGEPGAVLMKLETARKIGGFAQDNIYTIDLDYWVRALQFGGLHYINEPLASFRVHQGSQSIAMAKLQSIQYRELLINIKKLFPFVTEFDLLIGVFKSKFNQYLRLIFYKIYA